MALRQPGRAPARRALALLAAVLAAGPAVAAVAVKTLVFCAPGHPGNTAQAAATMESFAGAVAKGAGLADGSLAAEYYESEAAGVARLAQDDVVLALVTLPFYAKHRDDLGLVPRRVAAGKGGATEVFGLVARRGALPSPDALAGFEIVGVSGYAPDFVRNTILAGWGKVPSSVPIRFSSRVPSLLIRAAEGDKVAVLVDGEQMEALPGHPRAADLEVVAKSKPLPASLVCEVGKRSGDVAKSILAALDRMPASEAGAAALQSIRLTRFESADASRIDRDLGLGPRAGAPKQP